MCVHFDTSRVSGPRRFRRLARDERGVELLEAALVLPILLTLLLNPSDPSSMQVQGLVISLGYPVKINVPFTTLNATTITISTEVQMRQEL